MSIVIIKCDIPYPWGSQHLEIRKSF